MQQESYHYDAVIIGSGAAGLSLALHLAAAKQRVALLCKGPLGEGATRYAQGGIAAVMADDDSLESHINDTLNAGAGLCDRSIVEYTITHANDAIQWLVEHGVIFSQIEANHGETRFHLGQEGGHSHRRIVHADDATGREISINLVDCVKKNNCITTFEQHTAVDLIIDDGQCLGVYVYNNANDQIERFLGPATILACGGASKAYLYTTNPHVASGDGIAMAWRAGCTITDMEFNQFHPTCLYHPQARSFLLTEALRGEGAQLVLPNGERFMDAVDPRAELAPRDIVARAIDHQMKFHGIECVYLDISHQDPNFVRNHFPMTYQTCLQYNIDITKDRIPVVPAAHYTCGGVKTDRHARTNLQGLYAIGETASTYLHGANRMASNSLLECLVFARAAAEHILNEPNTPISHTQSAPWDESRVIDSDEAIVISHNWHECRRTLWNYVGIVRTNKRLTRAKRRVALLKEEIKEYYTHFRISRDFIELRNLVDVADIMIECALSRKESRGLHYSLDYPNPNTLQPPQHTTLRRTGI